MFDKQGIEEINHDDIYSNEYLSFDECLNTKSLEKVYAHKNDEAKHIYDDNLLSLVNSLKVVFKDSEVTYNQYIKELKIYNVDFDGRTLNTFCFEFCKFYDTSFENITFVNCTFNHCLFLNCYFRNVAFINCDFYEFKVHGCVHEIVCYENCVFDVSCQFAEMSMLKTIFPASTTYNIHFHKCSNLSIKK